MFVGAVQLLLFIELLRTGDDLPVFVSDICHRVQTQEFTYSTVRIKDAFKSQIFLCLCVLAPQKLPPDLNLLELEEYRDKLKRQQAAVRITFR